MFTKCGTNAELAVWSCQPVDRVPSGTLAELASPYRCLYSCLGHRFLLSSSSSSSLLVGGHRTPRWSVMSRGVSTYNTQQTDTNAMHRYKPARWHAASTHGRARTCVDKEPFGGRINEAENKATLSRSLLELFGFLSPPLRLLVTPQI